MVAKVEAQPVPASSVPSYPRHPSKALLPIMTTTGTAAVSTAMVSAPSSALAPDHPCNTSRDSCSSVDDPRDCSTTSSVLDTMDTCINCVEGVEVQRALDDDQQWTFLYPMIDLDDIDGDDDDYNSSNYRNMIDRAELEFGSAEPIEAATLIRLELMEDHAAKVRVDGGQSGPSAAPATLGVPDFDVLNLCGGSDDSDRAGFSNPLTATGAASGAAAIPSRSDPPATPMTTCGSYTACPRLDKAVDTTADTAATADIDNSFLSLSTVHDAVGSDHDNDGDDCCGEQVLAQCSVCLHEAFAGPRGGGAPALACLPCCGQHLCWTCVEALTIPSARNAKSDNGCCCGCSVGRCPCCRSWIVVETTPANSDNDRASENAKHSVTRQRLPDIHLVSVAGKCQECCQIKQLLLDGSVCDACIVGRQCPPLAYECDCCRHVQRISHPMYRYQPVPDAFGTVGWQCGACNQVSRWRIRPDQLDLVLVGDAPATWNDDAMEKARRRVQAARATDALSSRELAQDQGRTLSLSSSSFDFPVGSHSSCVIV
jgi:hypothetical protein